MASITANGVGLIDGTIDMPNNAVWTADLTLNTASGFVSGDKVTIATADGWSIQGTVATERSGSLVDTIYCRILGGSGGMGKQVSPAQRQQGSVRDVLELLITAAGETLSDTIDPAFLSTQLPQWTIKQDSVTSNLNQLIQTVSPSMHWRFLADGTLWIGNETWDKVSGDYQVLNGTPANIDFLFGVELPFILPGQQIDGYKIARVVHHITSGTVTSHVYLPIEDQQQRGIAIGLQKIIQSVTSGIDYYTTYSAKVISQNGNNVDVQPQDTRIAGLQNIPIKIGVAGMSVSLVPGAIVQLGWDGGNKDKPYVTSFQSESITNLTITTQAGDSITIGNGECKIQLSNTTMIDATAAGMTLGSNPVSTPILTFGAFDSMGVPVTNSPTNTNTIKSG